VSYRLTGEHTRANAKPWHQVGVVTALPRLAGVPVFAGAMDTWASAVGAGAVRSGQAYDVAGTSEAVGLLTSEPVRARGLMTLPWTDETHQVGGPTQAGADCARWCHALFRIEGRLEAAIERAGRLALHAEQPLFLPYLSGERAPVWSSEVRGAFHNVDRAAGEDEFLRATMEGVAMAVRDILDHAHAASPTRAVELRVSGGGARSDAWCRIKADVTGLTVLRSAHSETGVVGAAMAAAVGLRVHENMTDAADHMVRDLRRFAPRAQYAGLVDARFAKFRAMKAAALAMAMT
jgi:xylulokinase